MQTDRPDNSLDTGRENLTRLAAHPDPRIRVEAEALLRELDELDEQTTAPETSARLSSVGHRGEAPDPSTLEDAPASDSVRFWRLLGLEPREIRVLRKSGPPLLGVFATDVLAVEAILAADADPETIGVYATLNPTTKPATNALERGRRGVGTADGDVAARRWILFDFDPVRPASTPATDPEHELALHRARGGVAWLQTCGVPASAIILGDSGNGGHVLVRVDLPNDDEAKRLVDQAIAAAALWLSDDRVKVDCTVSNAARITRVLGTLNRKGEATAERPHRRSCLLEAPAELVTCPRAVLERIAGLAASTAATADAEGSRFDLPAWMAERSLPADGPHEWTGKGGKGRRWVVNPCPFNAAHDNRSAVLLEHASGAITFRCLHDSCADNDWNALRDLLEPGWRDRVSQRAAQRVAQNAADLTDVGNARRFARQHGERVRYVYPWRRWHVYDGVRWAEDTTGEVTRLAQQTADAILADAIAGDPEERKRLVILATRARDDHRIRAMLAQAQPLCSARPEEFDRDPFLLNCLNGTLNTQTGALRPHSRDDFITKLAPVVYDPDAQSALWDRFLHDITGGYGTDGDPTLEAFLQRIVGYALTGDTSEEVIFFLHGDGATGKTTFVEAIKNTLGDYATKTDFDTFTKRRESGGPRNGLARLAGMRFVASVEMDEGKQLAEGLVKQVTGGDTITAAFLYHESFEYRPTYKLFLVANHAPEVSSADEAMWRRILRVPLSHVVPKEHRDAQVKATLTDPRASGAAILAWAVRGCLAWQRDRLGVPAAVEQSTAAYREEVDTAHDFISECCECSASLTVTSKDLYARYLKWCRHEARKRSLSQPAFAKRLDALGFVAGKESGQRVRHGVALRSGGVEFTA